MQVSKKFCMVFDPGRFTSGENIPYNLYGIMNADKQHFLVAVIGGGPAGMMAAGRATECGAQTVLIEKNSSPGAKLLLTGKGRCNFTNSRDDLQDFIRAFGKNGKFLYQALSNFGPEDAIRFFENLGVKAVTERGGRVFPSSGRAWDVRAALQKYLHKNGATLITNNPVKELIRTDEGIDYLRLSTRKIRADKYVIAAGGLSYPSTGSTGDGFEWAAKLGHKVTPPRPSLAPVLPEEAWPRRLAGSDLKNVQVAVYHDNKKKDERFGEVSFMNDGIGGPTVLDMSKKIGSLPGGGKAQLSIDLKPALTHAVLDARLQRDFSQFSSKKFKNSLDKLLPKKLIPIMIELSGIDPDKKSHSITREERKSFRRLLKDLRVNVKGLAGLERAIITSGGVSLKEVDPRSMRSRLFPNLYFAGEVMDLDGPTGGYNLQMCWSTGRLAGESAAGL